MRDQIIDFISDHPWPYDWCQTELFGLHITLMSSAIFSMILAAVILMAVILPMARKHKYLPTGAGNVLEVLVVFVRDMIARPTLRDKAYDYLPFLLTLFVFILAMNLLGMVPLEPISHVAGLPRMGHTATSIPMVCAGLASLALLAIVSSGLTVQAKKHHLATGRPMSYCIAISALLWFRSLAPDVPGKVGMLLAGPLILLELVGAVAKCFSLMIRLCANMISGHALVAVLMLFLLQALRAYMQTDATHLFYVGPLTVLGTVAVSILELLVSGLQAYIFTFLTAMFLSLYAEPSH